jgi:hypothetical protein
MNGDLSCLRRFAARLILAPALLLGWVVHVPAQMPQAFPAQKARAKSLLPGLQVAQPTDLLRSHLPQLQAGHGLVVEGVSADAPGGLADLRRYDIILRYDGQALKNVDDLLRLALAGKPDRKVPMVVMRGGQEITLEITLSAADLAPPAVKGAIKPGGPPAVAIECTYLDGDKLQLILGYYSQASSKLQTLTCTGSLMEIEQQVREHQLPDRVEELVDVAIKKLRRSSPK